MRSLAKSVSRTDFAQRAMRDGEADAPIDIRPTPRLVFGLFLMGFSYLIGWPAVSFFAFLAWYLKNPLIVIIGGPVIYGISHLTFIAGVFLAGADYARIFMKKGVKKLLDKYHDEIGVAGTIAEHQ